MEKSSPSRDISEPVEIILFPSGSDAHSTANKIFGNLHWGDDQSQIEVDMPESDVVLSITLRSKAKLSRSREGAEKATSFEQPISAPTLASLLGGLNGSSDKTKLMLMMRWLHMRMQPGPGASSTQKGEKKLIKWRLKRVLAHIDAHVAGPLPLEELANAAGLSKMYFAAQFRAATGLRPHEFVLRRRVGFAKDLLQSTQTSIVEIAGSVGFQTQAHFTTVFKRYVGKTPAQWRAERILDEGQPLDVVSLAI